jgi:hypothetical protein
MCGDARRFRISFFLLRLRRRSQLNLDMIGNKSIDYRLAGKRRRSRQFFLTFGKAKSPWQNFSRAFGLRAGRGKILEKLGLGRSWPEFFHLVRYGCAQRLDLVSWFHFLGGFGRISAGYPCAARANELIIRSTPRMPITRLKL